MYITSAIKMRKRNHPVSDTNRKLWVM